MTRKVCKFLRKNMFKCIVGAVAIGYGAYGFITVNKYAEEYHLMQQQQQEQIQLLQEDVKYLNTEIKIIENETRYQRAILEKTSGRLINEHMQGGVRDSQVSRGIRENYSADTFHLLSSTKVTAHELNNALSDTNLAGLGEAFVRAELNTGVNALFLASLAKLESGNGTSALFHEKNNLFGFQAYDASPYESGKSFGSKEECIEYVAQFLKDNYCSEDGCYYRGGTIADVNYYYASNQQWGEAVFNGICKLEQKCS